MADSIKKIAIVTGTRADWGLLLPLVKEISARAENGEPVKPLVIATYAHLFPEMGDTISELVEDGFPPVMSVPARMDAAESVADTVTGFSKAFRFLRPDMVVVLGDRAEMLGVATAALLCKIPLAHIAGGTVSLGAYDNAIRHSISQMATLHFPETERGRRKLILMGANPKYVTAAGATGVYNTTHTPLISQKELEQSIGFELGEKFILGTFHPATLSELSAGDQMKIWLEGLQMALDADPDLKILLTFPNTDAEPNQLISLMFTFAANNRERVKIVDSLGRIRYLSAASLSKAVAGNSSSGIVEIPSLGIPVVNVGDRQRGRQCSKAVIHVPLDSASIAEGLALALTPEAKEMAGTTSNPYYKEDTPSIIYNKISDFLDETAVSDSGKRGE